MHKTISATILSLSFAAAAMPAFADYAEGDPRPQPLPTQATHAQVAAQTQQWLATAPTVGYPEGNPREFAQVGQNNRAQVSADAMAWSKAGLSGLAYGDAPLSGNQAAYEQASKSYVAMGSMQTSK
ncbi:MAG: hypothetical protein JSS56_04440 [Proteobacteria bacterium]|nr:hypothetical protein [Pseudomonadota bacterium]